MDARSSILDKFTTLSINFLFGKVEMISHLGVVKIKLTGLIIVIRLFDDIVVRFLQTMHLQAQPRRHVSTTTPSTQQNPPCNNPLALWPPDFQLCPEHKSHSRQSGVKSTKKKIIVFSKAKPKPLSDHSASPPPMSTTHLVPKWAEWAARALSLILPFPESSHSFTRCLTKDKDFTPLRMPSQRGRQVARGPVACKGEKKGLRQSCSGEVTLNPGGTSIRYRESCQGRLFSSLTLTTCTSPSASCPCQT